MTAGELEREAGVAVWHQIAATLVAEIESGALAEGSRLPTEPALAVRFGVNRHTVRRAIAHLTDRGLVRVEQGRGTFVSEHVLDYLVGRRTRFSEIVTAQNRQTGGRLLEGTLETARAAVARELGLRRGARVVHLETLRDLDGRPLALGTHYFSAARFPDMIELYRQEGSITKALVRCGLADYERKTTRVTARLPEAADARLLRQPGNRPVLVTESLNVDAEGRPVEFGITRFASDRMQVVFGT
ncbi:phosphonate metabolism transcriptional regulator PhnF [Algihabitans albus]|uniref:phosphonate metabolism transcriptional regulator PhnF n=1 Tax=Algihabitans albus TaxID=2164067 RepID=UPI001F3319B1|nr:phosphonate metabolism transcriptional regulator PhnF [Algihabitans albus]